MEGNGVTRRNFLKIGGAAAALGTSGPARGNGRSLAKTGTLATLYRSDEVRRMRERTHAEVCGSLPKSQRRQISRAYNWSRFAGSLAAEDPRRLVQQERDHRTGFTPYNWTTVSKSPGGTAKTSSSPEVHALRQPALREPVPVRGPENKYGG